MMQRRKCFPSPREERSGITRRLRAAAHQSANMLTRRVLLAAMLGPAACLTSAAEAQRPTVANAVPVKLSFLGVRVLKAPGAGELKWTAELPPECLDCQLILTEYAAGQNAKEFYFHAWVPAGKRLNGPIRVRVDPSKVRGVLVSYTDTEMGKRGYASDRSRMNGLANVKFSKSSGAITFDVPTTLQGVSMPPDDLGDVTQYYTYIETPGVYIRIGHADLQRRAGPYATGPWPAKQAAAAINLEFATREAISALELEKALPRLGVSTIMLMNFDTNYPTLGPDEAHEDWPPHWHMHLFWNDVPKVRKVGHFYLSEDALLTGEFSSDLVGSSFTNRAKRWYPNGTANETRTPAGELVYSQTITSEGFFKLGTATGSCTLKPVGRGFDLGAIVECDNGAQPVRIRAEDDPAAGTLLLHRDGRLDTEYRYDADNGAVTSTRKLPR